MSTIQELKKSLVQEAKDEAAKIVSLAWAEAGQKIGAARAGGEKIIAQARERAEKQAAAERSQRLSAGQLKARKMLSEAQNMVLSQGIAKIWKEFSELPESRAEYERLLKRLIPHAEREIGKGAIVLVNSRDQALARRLSRNVSPEKADIAGGAIVASSDRSISIDSSLESIFAQREEELRKLIYAEIFGGKKK